MRTLIIFVFTATLPFIVGCGTTRPKEMPETAPCEITVLQDGKPMTDIIVSLYREGGNGALSIGGTTDASGIAKIKTTWGAYTTDGAPVGTCKVTVDKVFDFPRETVTPEEMDHWTPEQGRKYEQQRQEMIDKLRATPAVLAGTSSPLSVSIESRSGGNLTVEISDYKK